MDETARITVDRVLEAFQRVVEEGQAQGKPWEETAAIRIATDDAGGTKTVGEIMRSCGSSPPGFGSTGSGI